MEKKKEKKIYWLLCSFYIVYYITLGVFTPYLNVYYERLGFTGSQIGTITSLGLIASMCMTPVWGALSDKTRNPKGVIAFVLVLGSIVSWFWMKQREYTPVLVLSIILSIFRQNVWSLVDGVGIQVSTDVHRDFGFARSMGSLGYLLGAFVVANGLSELGLSGPFMGVFILCSLVSAVMIVLMPTSEVKEKEKSEVKFTESTKSLLTNQKFVFVVIIMMLTSLVVDIILNYSGNHLVSTLGQNESMIGIFSFAQVFPEILIVMFANRIFRRMNLQQIFMFGAIAQFVRFAICAFTSNMAVFLLATTLHGISIAVASVGYVSYIHKHVDRKILATAMSFYGTANTIGSALLTQIFGIVYEIGTSYQLFGIGAICAIVAIVLILSNKNLNEKL